MQYVLEERSSKGIVKDYYTRFKPEISPKNKSFKELPFIEQTLMSMVKADPILFSAVELTVDTATSKGYDFLGENSREIKRARKLFNDKLDFDQIISNILFQIQIYGNAYLEVRWNESKTEVIELHALESSEMKIEFNENGDILYYLQKVAGKGKEHWPTFDLDEVIHFRMYNIGSSVYSHAPFEAITRSYANRVYANDYLMKIFLNMPPKMIYFLKNASEKQRELFFENLIRAKQDYRIDVVAQGEAFDSKLAEVSFDNGLMQVLDYLRKEVLMITRVPPHWIGLLDGANRGIGENVVIPFKTKITKLQQKIASQINHELMPKLKLSNLEFKWNAVSLMDDKEIIANMAQLKAIQYDSETITEYGRERGLDLNEDAEIEQFLPPTGGPQIQDDSAPSRQRANPAENMNNKIDEQGVSKEGAKKLEQKQVKV